jgi:flagellar biosynthesis protein FlhF
MRIKRIRGRSMIDALRKVKEELGENAVIMDSEKVVDNGVEFYEVIAAIDEPELPKPPEPSKPKENTVEEGGFLPFTAIEQKLFLELQEIKEMVKALSTPQLRLKKEIELLRLCIPPFMVDKVLAEDKSLVDFVKEGCKRKGVPLEERFRVFIGEPGCGKTTILFKIAFKLKKEGRGKVLIVSVDNYKIGGREQFQRMSQFLEIPYLWTDWDELINRFPSLKQDFDYVLVDTPGLGKKFMPEDLVEITRMLRELRFCLVVKATEDFQHHLELWQRLRDLPISELALTFVDKLKRGAPLFWLLDEDIPPVSYFSTGERVPEDLIKVEPQDLVNLLLRGMNKI